MTATAFDHVGPWSEEDYLALDVTGERVELFDGSLYVSPAPTPQHQHVSQELLAAMRPGARAAGCRLYAAINVRLRPGRILIPDLVVTNKIDSRRPIVEAADVRLVCEVLSPSTSATDKVLKMHHYATARIDWYLLVEQDTAALSLYCLEGDHYVPHSSAAPGQRLIMTDPLDAVLVPAALGQED
jgi:Uma2 family endonuclease